MKSCLKVALSKKSIIINAVSSGKTTWPHRLAARTLASHARNEHLPEFAFQEIELSKQTFKYSRHFENGRKRGCLKVALFTGHFFCQVSVGIDAHFYLGGYSN